MLPNLDMNDPEQRQQAAMITARFKEDYERMLVEDHKITEFRSRLAYELGLSHPNLSFPKTWVEVLGTYGRWFDQNRTVLLERFDGQHVAVTNSSGANNYNDLSVVDNDNDEEALRKRVRDRYGATPVLIRFVERTTFLDAPIDHFFLGLRN